MIFYFLFLFYKNWKQLSDENVKVSIADDNLKHPSLQRLVWEEELEQSDKKEVKGWNRMQ